MNIAVVGAGIFGCCSAIELSKAGHNVTLFDKNDRILSSASQINQYRLHRGYHYPRSVETVTTTKQTVEQFEEMFSSDLLVDFDRYYAIAKEGSITSPEQYIQFLNENGLEYEVVDPFIDVPLMVKVKENSFNPFGLYYSVLDKLRINKVNVKLNTLFSKQDIDRFDVVVNATYSDINGLIDEFEQEIYQFELIEKVTVHTPPKYKNKSLVILDGNFCCIDPIARSEYSMLGHVKEAIHDIQIGTEYKIPEKYTGVVNNLFPRLKYRVSNHPQIIKACEELLECKLEYLSSSYTIRTVLANREHDDARPTNLIKHNSKFYSLFGGKIGTAVSTARELTKMLG